MHSLELYCGIGSKDCSSGALLEIHDSLLSRQLDIKVKQYTCTTCAQKGRYHVSNISACMKNKTRLRVLVWLLNYQSCIVITSTGVFSVSIVDVHVSNSMARDLRMVS